MSSIDQSNCIIENVEEPQHAQLPPQYHDKKVEALSAISPSNTDTESDADEKQAESKFNDQTDDDWEDFSDIDEKKLIRRIDFMILPVFTILYLLSFLDRGNIGNAKIEGLDTDLKLVGNQYNIALTVFFIFYASLEVPSNIILKHVNPAIFIPATMTLWSIVMVCMGTVNNYHQLLATRCLLGIFEAPSFPGISFILSMYYTKDEILMREAIFFGACSVAGGFSGLLAAAISNMDGIGGYAGWRWIFILEGLLTFVYSILCFFMFPSFPNKASFLTEKERRFVTYRVKHSTNKVSNKAKKFEPKFLKFGSKSTVDNPSNYATAEDHSSDPKYIWAVFKDWQSYFQLILYMGVDTPVYGISLFTPTIIKTLGYSSTHSQLLSVPIFIVATVFSIFQSYVSSYFGVRSPFLILDYLIMLVGYIVCITGDPVNHPRVIYAGSYICALGAYSAFPIVVIWNANNLAGSYKRAVGLALQIGIGNFSGAFASNFYRGKDAPKYILGHACEIGFIGLGMICLVCLIFGYSYSNYVKSQRLQSGYYDNYTEEELIKMGDKNPYYKYRL